MGTSYHPQTSGMVERMNQTCEQVLRCLIHELGDASWEDVLPMVQFVINSTPSAVTGYSPFYLNFGFHPVTPMEMMRDREESLVESTEEFLQRMDTVFKSAKQQMEKANEKMKMHADKRRKAVTFKVNDLVLLSTQNLRMKDVPTKFAKRFVGPFKILAKIGENAYTLELPDGWKIHPTFHVSLLKEWKESVYTSGGPVSPDQLPIISEEGEELWETEKLLRWRWRKVGNKKVREFLVLWKGFPLHEASWVLENDFTYPDILKQDIEKDQPEQDATV